MIEDWDLSDSDESAVVPSDGLINFFKKKEAIIELSAMIERQKRPMTATEIQRLFRHEFHQDFPYFHFGFNSMGKFLDDIRGVVHDGNLPDGTRLYIADPRYKYHLLRAMARGGCAADGANEKGATAVLNKNTNVGAVVAHLVQPAVQQMAHKNEGDFGFPSRGRRGMTWITPVENGGGPSRFSGVPKTPSHPPADPPVMPQVQQQQSREQQGEQQRDQENGLLGQGALLQAVPCQKLNIQPDQLVKQGERPVQVVGMEDVVSGGQEKDPSEMAEESEPCLVPIKGVNRIAEEKTLGGRLGGQSQCNAFKANVSPSVADDILGFNLSQPATDNNPELVTSNNTVAKEGNPMADKEVNPAVQHEMSMGAQETTMKTITISRVIAFEEAVEFLKMAFPAVGKKINVRCVSDAVLSVIEANPRHFGFGADHNGREVELLRPMEEALAKPEKPLLQAASLEDLTWMLEGKTVASEEEPFDLALIVYQTADVVVCASATFGVKNSLRVRAISEELKNLLESKSMERAVIIRTGWIYVATHEEHLVRVIVVGQRCDDHFLAILVDGAGQVILKAYGDIWEVPAGCGIEDVPANIYLARHKAKNAFSEKLADLVVSSTRMEMFFHSQTPRDGIRTADWLDLPHKSSWFSGENPIAVDAMRNAIEVRQIGGYFDTELATPLATMTPYSQRKKMSPIFIKEMEKVAAVVVLSEKDVEERREIATHALAFFEKLTKRLAIPDEEAADAVKLYNDLHAEAFAL